MKNFICINGKKIELPEDKLRELRSALTENQNRLGEKGVGETVKIGKYDFVVLEHSKETTAVILKSLLRKSVFSETDCDFKTSTVKTMLEAFEQEIADVIGADNLIVHTVDLTSNDGLKDYGRTTAKMSLLTADLYRRYVEILDTVKPDSWWWLATPYSTKKHGYKQYVLCVAPSGDIDDDDYVNCYDGVRPFCILNSNIFVS